MYIESERYWVGYEDSPYQDITYEPESFDDFDSEKWLDEHEYGLLFNEWY